MAEIESNPNNLRAEIVIEGVNEALADVRRVEQAIKSAESDPFERPLDPSMPKQVFWNKKLITLDPNVPGHRDIWAIMQADQVKKDQIRAEKEYLRQVREINRVKATYGTRLRMLAQNTQSTAASMIALVTGAMSEEMRSRFKQTGAIRAATIALTAFTAAARAAAMAQYVRGFAPAGGLFPLMSGKIGQGIQWITENIGKIAKIGVIVTAIIAGISGMFEAFESLWERIPESIKSGISTAWEITQKIISSVWEFVKWSASLPFEAINMAIDMMSGDPFRRIRERAESAGWDTSTWPNAMQPSGHSAADRPQRRSSWERVYHERWGISMGH